MGIGSSLRSMPGNEACSGMRSSYAKRHHRRREGSAGRSIPERAAVLAWIGTARERALVPVDPDRLTAAERPDHAGGLMPELLEALDDIGWHAILELVDAFVMQAARHIDRLLHVATVVEHVGQHMHLPDRLILPAHHAERHH